MELLYIDDVPFSKYLEIRYPERGRKLNNKNVISYVLFFLFGNKIPREGTETMYSVLFIPHSFT